MKQTGICNTGITRNLSLFILTLISFLLLNINQSFAADNQQTILTKQLEFQHAWVSKQNKIDQVSFIGTRSKKAISVTGTNPDFSALQNALVVTRTYGALFGIQDSTSQLSLLKQKTLADGRSMARFQQVHQGIPILGAELIVNMDSQQRLLAMNGETSSVMKDINTIVATIDAEQAKDMALTAVAKWHKIDPAKLQSTTPQLKIYDPGLIGPGNAPGQLVWHITVSNTELQPIKELVLINAQLGFIALHFNQLHTAKNRSTYDSGGSIGNYYNLPGTLVCDEAAGDDCSNGVLPEADNAHKYAGDAYDFFFNKHNRDSIDDLGMELISTIDFCFSTYSCPFANAFWDGSQMVYGKGMVADDVAGHEITHGFTEHTSNLFYFYQSGAINESLSDMWGEFIDLTNTGGSEQVGDRWYLGEDLAAFIGYGSYRGAIRSMSDPTQYGDPDKMSSPNYWLKSLDNGGVHINSGINNKAVYLMTDGDTFNGITIKGIGIDKVAQIYYEAATTMLSSASNYAVLYDALIQSCNNLVGTKDISNTDCAEVKNALDAVEMNQEPSPGFTPRATICPGSTTPSYVFKDDLESGLGNWKMTNANEFVGWGDSSINSVYGNYTSSGTHALYSLGHDAETSDQYAQTTVTVPAVNPYLHFNHAFEFENSGGDFFDGGVVEYSLDSETWQDMGALYDAGQDYKGTILAGITNPLAGRAGFAGASHGYVSSRYNLSSLAGQQIHVRWRHGTDQSYVFLGWYIDDISVYSCAITGNNPPSAAKLLAPINNATVTRATATLEWESSTDPDGDPVTETVLLCQGTNCVPGIIPESLLSFAHTSFYLASMGGSSFLLFGLLSNTAHRRRKIAVITLVACTTLLSGCPFDKNSTSTTTENVPNESLTINNLQTGTSYRWMVRSSDDKGGVTNSEVQTFSVN